MLVVAFAELCWYTCLCQESLCPNCLSLGRETDLVLYTYRAILRYPGSKCF